MATPTRERAAANLAALAGQRDEWTPEARAEVAVLLVAQLDAYVPEGDWRRALRTTMSQYGQASVFDQAEPEPSSDYATEPQPCYCGYPSCADCGRGTTPGWQGQRVSSPSACCAPTDDGRSCNRRYGHDGAHTHTKAP